MMGGNKETVLPLAIATSDKILIAAPVGASSTVRRDASPRAESDDSDNAAKASGATGRPLPAKIPAPKTSGAASTRR
jgi:hypothetical protein